MYVDRPCQRWGQTVFAATHGLFTTFEAPSASPMTAPTMLPSLPISGPVSIFLVLAAKLEIFRRHSFHKNQVYFELFRAKNAVVGMARAKQRHYISDNVWNIAYKSQHRELLRSKDGQLWNQMDDIGFVDRNSIGAMILGLKK